jgi:hypothetical protein
MGVALAAIPANWLCEPGRNPFNLQPPPETFRRELAAYDPDIVIFPSAQRFGYWLTRRRRLTKGIQTVLNLTKDSAVMARNDLIPVTLFGGHITWGANVLQWLADRDVWRHGGADRAADIADEQDKQADAAYNRWRDGENTARAKSMYRTYKRRVGESIVVGDTARGYTPIKRGARTESDVRRDLTLSTGSAPVPPTAPSVVLPGGWGQTASGLVTPPTT